MKIRINVVLQSVGLTSLIIFAFIGTGVFALGFPEMFLIVVGWFFGIVLFLFLVMVVYSIVKSKYE